MRRLSAIALLSTLAFTGAGSSKEFPPSFPILKAATGPNPNPPRGRGGSRRLFGEEEFPKKRVPQREADWQRSCVQGNAIAAKRREERRIYKAWIASLGEAERAKVRELGVEAWMPDAGFRREGSEDALDHSDRDQVPADQIRGARNGKPIITGADAGVDAMEPEDFRVDVANLSPAEVRGATEDFALALRWALGVRDWHNPKHAEKRPVPVHPLVELGRRNLALVACLRPDVAGSVEADPGLARSLLSSYGEENLGAALQRLRPTGQIYGRVLEWMRRGSSFSALGERLQFVAYELRPDLIDAETLEELGAATSKTRQAMSKAANCLRDTFAGLRALTQRPDITRIRCKLSQLGLSQQPAAASPA